MFSPLKLNPRDNQGWREMVVRVLGIETSCDETAVAIVADGRLILSNVVSSQAKFHERFGGIVPEVAARKHVELINFVLHDALTSARLELGDLDAVAVTAWHGLFGALVIGVAAAKAIAFAHRLPLIGVHHVEGHLYSNVITEPNIEFPYVCLTASGGHTMIIFVRDHGKYEVLGETRDDAAGENFDKVAKFLGLGFPGGPLIDKLSDTGDRRAFAFPRPMIKDENLDFSFSGLKTAVIHTLRQYEASGQTFNIADIAASVQEAIVEVLVKKTVVAARRKGVSTIAVTGGVAANTRLRELINEIGQSEGFKVVLPPKILCVDNGAMVAAAGFYKLMRGQPSQLDLAPLASAPLGEGS